jgi:uncharacterized protein YgiM (DUF1202 family)
MGKIQTLILGLLGILIVILGGFYAWTKIKPAYAKILVEGNKSATVYVDNQFVGKNPYIGKVKNRQVEVRVIPDDVTIAPIEVRVNTLEGKSSLVKVYFAKDPTLNSNVIVYPESIGGRATEISIVSLPQTAQVRVDGQVKGFSPLKFNATLGKHNVEVSFEGYRSETFEIETFEGVRMISVVNLGKDHDVVQSNFASPTPEPKKIEVAQVEILDTPTGYLRVREEPSSQSKEIGQVNPGEKYDYLESNSDRSWHKIQLEGLTGWVSSEYSKVLESQ